jgi:ABC-2 type transporter
LTLSESLETRRPLWWRTCVLSGAEYGVVYGRRLLLISGLSRSLLQVVFLTLLGQYSGGDTGRRFAFTGAVCFVAVPSVVIRLSSVIVPDRWQGTMYRLRLGPIPILGIMVLRSWVYLVEGIVLVATTLIALGPWLVGVEETRALAADFPLLSVTVMSGLCVGFFVSASALGRRVEVMLPNALSYLILVGSGVVIPPGANGWIDAAGRFLPLRHGLDAIRTGAAGGRLAGLLATEAAIGAGWLACAWLLLALQSYRARRVGFDDFV